MKNNISVLLQIFKETGLIFLTVEDINWNTISRKPLSEKFIREFKNNVNWYNISMFQQLSENFIKEFQNEVDWDCISKHQKLSEDFIIEFQNDVRWYYISKLQKLSENFIREFKNKVNWVWICFTQTLSEDFIREFQNKVDWEYVCTYQKLSENFIREFKDKVWWRNIFYFQKLSPMFIDEFNIEVVKNKIKPYSNNWLYENTEFKKKQVINTGLYKCYNDYFIAYKAIRKDRYSFYNFQYQYLKGGIYECHCDTTNNENSFGLSAWTKKEAKNYNNKGLIVRVKIKYEDIGRIVHDGGKIRCFKFEIID